MGAGQISFGPFLLDRSARTLLSGGKPVALGQRALALLDALAAADGPVDKAALIEAAWPETIVEDGNLTVQIAALRKALGTRPDGQEWIVTVPRVGYRLVRSAALPNGGQATSPLPSVAVLPFKNLSGDSEQDYFADGIVEDVITALSRFKSFAVVASNSSFVYKGRAIGVREVAEELGVRYVVEGSVRRSGDRLRVSARLVDGQSAAELWGQSFDGSLEDVFDIQDRVTDNVVAIVEPRIKRAEIERSRRKRPESLDAYDLYLQALPEVFAMRPETNRRALDLLERATALDPGFAPAHAATALAYLGRITMQLAGSEESDREKSIAVAQAALAAGRDDPMVMAHAGFILLEIGLQYDEGFALLRRAAAESPNNVSVLTNIGIACLLAGDLDEGETFLERALALNPNDFGTHWQLTGIAHIRMAQRRFEEAIEAAGKSLAINSGYDATYWMLIAANAYLGRMDEARRYRERLQDLSPGITLSRIRRGQHAADADRIDVLIEGMRIAGLPE
jgi:TolB-like protein/Tfp pilus assembly protein PilF